VIVLIVFVSGLSDDFTKRYEGYPTGYLGLGWAIVCVVLVPIPFFAFKDRCLSPGNYCGVQDPTGLGMHVRMVWNSIRNDCCVVLPSYLFHYCSAKMRAKTRTATVIPLSPATTPSLRSQGVTISTKPTTTTTTTTRTDQQEQVRDVR